MIQKILIANRGEIVKRILRTCKQMGIQTVAVYSDADRDAAYLKEADEAVYIGKSAPIKSYLNIEALIGAVKQTGRRRGTSRLRLPVRVRRVCPGGGAGRRQVDRPHAPDSVRHRVQVLLPNLRRQPGGTGDPRLPAQRDQRRGDSGHRPAGGLSGSAEAGQGRRRQGHPEAGGRRLRERRPDHAGEPPADRPDGLCQRRGLCGKGGAEPPPHRGPVLCR